MAADHLLSDLCSICHTNLPKYRCPRCQTQTCSLPCVQRHKARAQCNGQRDPTAYIKKQHLATPSAIDHDFNFIRSIERGVDKGEEILNSHDHREKWQKNYPALQRRFQEVGVRVHKAPTGLSRNRENTTHWAAKSKSLFWTVEWIFEDSRHLDNFNEHTVLEQAHTWLLRRITNDKRKQKDGPDGTGSDKRSKRRKAKAEKAHSDGKAAESSTADQIVCPAQAVSDEQKPSLDQTGVAESAAEGYTDPSIDNADSTSNGLISADERTEQPNVELGQGIELQDGADQHSARPNTSAGEGFTTKISDDPNGDVALEQETKTPVEIIKYHFYLIKPRTTASKNAKVLVPIPANSTLATALKGQLVLEFPTIQVLTQDADQLPEGYVLDKEYVGEEQKMTEKLKEEARDGVDAEIKLAIPGDEGYEIEGGTEGNDSNVRMPNQSDLMTILQRDIIG